jgi:hypothetical protein
MPGCDQVRIPWPEGVGCRVDRPCRGVGNAERKQPSVRADYDAALPEIGFGRKRPQRSSTDTSNAIAIPGVAGEHANEISAVSPYGGACGTGGIVHPPGYTDSLA